MITEGDRILIGLSGGKDSLVLLHALSDLRKRSPAAFELAACTIAITGMNVTPLEEYCAVIDVPYFVLRHPVMEIIETPGERSPCSFCANMRRGMLSSFAQDSGFNKLALGHNLEDAVETFFINTIRAGRARSFKPKVFLSRTGITVIRPLIGASSASIADEAARLSLPVIKTCCPYAGHTERQRIRELLADLKQDAPELFSNVINALENLSSEDSWQGQRPCTRDRASSGAEGEAEA